MLFITLPSGALEQGGKVRIEKGNSRRDERLANLGMPLKPIPHKSLPPILRGFKYTQTEKLVSH